MALSRRQFGATAIGSVTAFWAGPSIAQGKKISLKVGGQFADSHPSSKAMEEACAEIRRQSDGHIDIQFFPNAQLGSDAAMLTQVRSGALEGSGVDPTETVVDMMASMRAYESGQKVIQTIDETLSKAASNVGALTA